jgi:hypothetical protein
MMAMARLWVSILRLSSHGDLPHPYLSVQSLRNRYFKLVLPVVLGLKNGSPTVAGLCGDTPKLRIAAGVKHFGVAIAD